MYTLYERVEKDSDLSTFYDNIEKLASSVGVNPKAIVDEIATLFVSSGSVCIFELFTSKSLENHQSVRQLCEFNILVVPHNMQVESGFSEMKLAESKYQNHFLLDTYDALRRVRSFFEVDRENFAVYKKLTSADLKRKIDTSQKEIDDLQAKLSKAMDQKERFEKESRGQSVLAETTSANVIDQMF